MKPYLNEWDKFLLLLSLFVGGLIVISVLLLIIFLAIKLNKKMGWQK